MTLNMNIFAKLLISFFIIIVLSFILSNAILSTLFRSNLRHDTRMNLDRSQQHIVGQIRIAYDKGWDRETLRTFLEFGIPVPDRMYLLFDKNGQALYTVGDIHIDAADYINPDMIDRVLKGQTVQDETTLDRKKLFIVASPIPGSENYEEKAIITLFFGFERNFKLFWNPSILSAMITIPIAGIVFYWFSRRLTRPLKEMNDTALKFAKGHFEQRINVRTKDEIGQLGESLNYMADELSSLDHMRKEFLANVSHDMRSPLTSINGFLSALIDGTIPPQREKHYLLMIRDSSNRMMKLVEDLLDIARIESRQFTIAPVRFNLSEHIRQTIARMEPLFTKHQIDIQMEEDGEDVWVIADPDRIEQVMINILQNAVYHSPLNARVEISVRDASGETAVSITDYGSGMSKEELKRIWDRFYKGDRARSRKTGTGIGLSIVKHILDLHGSRIDVDSEVGKGTTIRFTLRSAD